MVASDNRVSDNGPSDNRVGDNGASDNGVSDINASDYRRAIMWQSILGGWAIIGAYKLYCTIHIQCN